MRYALLACLCPAAIERCPPLPFTRTEHGRNLKVLAENDMDGRIRITPVAHDGVLFVATENRLYAIARPK